MPRPTVFMHVGSPKTGTTFLQDVLWHNREALAADGVLFPRRRYSDHYQASLDVRRVDRALRRNPQIEGAWDRVARDTRRWSGPAVISHELFAPATSAQAAKALAALEPAEVHIVVTLRDLWRQLPAEWQESTKHGRAFTLAEYLHDVVERGPDGVVGGWFWSVQDGVDILRRWGSSLPPERVHVVTVPPRGSPPGLLWERFAGLVGIEPGRYRTHVARPNASLGPAEVALLRRVNAELTGGQVYTGRPFARHARGLLAQEILARRPDIAPITIPAEWYDGIRKRSEQVVEGLAAAGYDVVGDLEELVPAPPQATPAAHPDAVGDDAVLDRAVDAIAGITLQMVRLREGHGIGVGPSTPPGRLRRWAAAAADSHPAVRRTTDRIRAGTARTRGRLRRLRSRPGRRS